MKTKSKAAALFLVFVMALTTMYIPVNAAGKVKVQSVTVQSKASGSGEIVYVVKGKKVKLSTSVSVTPNKKANKGLTFKSKNKKIATVNKKGEITGKKVGTTKITVTSKKNKKKKDTIKVKVVKSAVTKVSSKGIVNAVGVGTTTITSKAIDGSGKKATCKVTVQEKLIDLSNITVLNEQTVSFSLSSPAELRADMIEIHVKSNAAGAYNKKLNIESIQTTDKMNYTVSLTFDSQIREMDYVQVSIPSLNGEKTKETVYKKPIFTYTEDTIITGYVGERIEEELYFSEGKGYSSLSITNLPAGITYTNSNTENRIELTGEYTSVGEQTATFTAKDELGNELVRKITFCVASDNYISATANRVYALTTSWNSANIYAEGGSGSYDYAFKGESYDCTINQGSFVSVEGTIKKEGIYTIPIIITDKNNTNLKKEVNVVFDIKRGITISGTITDSARVPNAIEDSYIVFKNKNEADKYSSYCTAHMYNGNYEANILPGTYNVTTYLDEEVEARKLYYEQTFTETKGGCNYSLPLYKVSIDSVDGFRNYSSWKDTNGTRYGYGDALYVKPGNYTLQSLADDWWNGVTTYQINCSVSNDAVSVKPSKVSGVISDNGTINVGEIVNGAVSKKRYAVYSFTPSEDGTYKFNDLRSSGSYIDISMKIYDIKANKELASGDEVAWATLIKDQTYYIGITPYYSEGAGSFSFNVEKR